ncbi:Arc family DNA-binding protein [Pseudomonas cichorii]|nr:Arc family DNA-binding protein [Pseudomonas cichorii]
MADSREQDKFVLRLPDGLRPRIAAEASENHRSMNSEIIFRLERSEILQKLQEEQSKVISQLLVRIDELESQQPPTASAKEQAAC